MMDEVAQELNGDFIETIIVSSEMSSALINSL